MKSRGFVLASLALGAASLGWWSCSGQTSDQHPRNDAGAAATGATGGSGGASATGGASPGGAGGTGNSGGIDWGPAPKWESTGLVVATCPIERLANASEIRMFAWQPCAWAPNDCEQAVFNAAVVGTKPVLVARVSTVQDDGTDVRVGLALALVVGPDLRLHLGLGTGRLGLQARRDDHASE